MVYIRIGADLGGSISLQFGLVSTQDPVSASDNPDGAQVAPVDLSTIVDLGTNSVCQFGFTTGVTGGGCGSCRYTSFNLAGTTLNTLVGVRTNEATSQPADVCPYTMNGRPLT
jgi:hypothetical protein